MAGGGNREEWERKILMDELIQGREFAKQLQININSPSSSLETREPLVNRILESYEKALSMLNMSGATAGEPSLGGGGAAFRSSESPPSLGGSPVSERDLRKRKSIPKWTRKVQVAPGTVVEGALDDGYSWRKYGQKDILGAKHPRGYYRCTHQKLQGCTATKQVQRSDADPTVYEITYRGHHTCSNQHQSSDIVPLRSSQSNEDLGPNPNPLDAQTNQFQLPQDNQQQNQGIFLEFCRGLRVITDGFDSQHHPLPPFSNIMGDSSPPYVSPVVNSIPGPSSGTSSYMVNQDFHGSELARIMSATTSAMSSPTRTTDFNFSIDKGEFDPNKEI